MLRLLARRGLRKSPAQTPLEFVASVPDGELAAQVSELTSLYQAARYGGAPADSPGGSSRYRNLLAGYTEAMSAAGLGIDPAWTALPVSELRRAPVTAVLSTYPGQTQAALRALRGAGDRRVAVVGFGDFEAADLLAPPVTVVSYDPVLIGSTAGELLIRRMSGEQGPPRRVEVPVRLIARGSAEFPPD